MDPEGIGYLIAYARGVAVGEQDRSPEPKGRQR